MVLNSTFIICTTISAVLLAVFINEISSKYYKKITQSAMLFPTFVSWIIVASILEGILGTEAGFLNNTLRSLGLGTVAWYSKASLWPFILTIVKVWKNSGIDSVIYLAVIAGMDNNMFEAATIDGASRLQKIRYITLPCLVPTIIMLTILAVGKIFYGDFGMFYGLIGDNGMLLPTTDVIDTYVYRALRKFGDIGMASSVGLFQSVVGFTFVLTTNFIAKKYNSEGALF